MVKNFIIKFITSLVEVQVLQLGVSQTPIQLFSKMASIYLDLVQFNAVAQSCPTLCNHMTARQASLSITNSGSLLKLMSIEPVMPSKHLILCSPLLIPSSIFPSIRVFSNKSVLRIRWPKYWSFSFHISPSNEYSGWYFL